MLIIQKNIENRYECKVLRQSCPVKLLSYEFIETLRLCINYNANYSRDLKRINSTRRLRYLQS